MHRAGALMFLILEKLSCQTAYARIHVTNATG
jgi:hypothetical protein